MNEKSSLATSYVRLIYTLKKDIEEWAEINLKDLWPGKFQLSFMQVMIYIDEEGTTNKKLASQARISKQAMSRIISNMLEADMIKVVEMPSDKRYSQITLTSLGKSVAAESQRRVCLFLEEKLKKAGISNFQNILDIMTLLH